jgi:D-psicose/D-tagatose/L-ribulose 3-epimerase
MRFGVCASPDRLPILEKAGWDYIEPSVSGTLRPEAPEEEVMPALIAAIDASSIKAEAYNVMLSGDVKVVGENTDRARQERYLRSGFARAARLGGKVIVFGSAGARGVPEGFSRETARQQVEDFLPMLGDIAAENGLTVVIEPLSVTECNHITSVAEATGIVRKVNHPAIKVLSDIYHVTTDGQSFEETRAAGALLKHVHVAGSVGRRAPVEEDIPHLTPLFRVLKDINYDGRVSVEGEWTDMAAQAADVLGVLRRAWDEA